MLVGAPRALHIMSASVVSVFSNFLSRCSTLFVTFHTSMRVKLAGVAKFFTSESFAFWFDGYQLGLEPKQWAYILLRISLHQLAIIGTLPGQLGDPRTNDIHSDSFI